MDASEVYDRQIRLWGLEAQKRMQEARVLFCGLRALPAEVDHGRGAGRGGERRRRGTGGRKGERVGAVKGCMKGRILA
jgi:hypothetical protein